MKKKQLLIQIILVIIFCGFAVFLILLPGILKNCSDIKGLSVDSLTIDGIYQILMTIKDPEVDINIVDLGLIQDVQEKVIYWFLTMVEVVQDQIIPLLRK